MFVFNFLARIVEKSAKKDRSSYHELTNDESVPHDTDNGVDYRPNENELFFEENYDSDEPEINFVGNEAREEAERRLLPASLHERYATLKRKRSATMSGSRPVRSSSRASLSETPYDRLMRRLHKNKLDAI